MKLKSPVAVVVMGGAMVEGTLIAQSRPAQVLLQALQRGRLPHAILLHGPDLAVLEALCGHLAAQLLKEDKPFAHPDLFALRPANLMRQIGVDAMRELTRQIGQSAREGGAKVAVIYEADRMNASASNAFLKTLEEPPRQTTLFLLSTRPYELLATIRSRCMNVAVPADLGRVGDPQWQQWLADYTELLQITQQGGRQALAQMFLGAYGLMNRFGGIVKSLSDTAWGAFAAQLGDGLPEEERAALERGFQISFRQRLLGEIEEQTRNFALYRLNDDPLAGSRLARSVKALEAAAGLLKVNFKEGAALEHYLLQALRIWSR